MKKQRLFYLDFVRAIAVVSILMTHFNARYLYLVPPMPEKAVITTMVSNIYIGNWGVSLFFIISGSALMYVYQDKLEVKKFYKKRFLSIYPMFWMAYIAAFAYFFIKNHVIPGAGAPKVNFIFTVLGLDGMLAAYIPTFYILGEWFLGTIILMYLLFPLLRIGVNKKPVLTAVAVLVIYGAMFFLEDRVNISIIVLTRLPEIAFGMYFVRWEKRVDWKAALGAFLLLVVNGIAAPAWSSMLQTTYVGIASFIVLVFLSYHLKVPACEKLCNVLSKYSYAIFLVHHVIIAEIMARFDLAHISVAKSYLLFAGTCVVIAVFAWILFQVHAFIMGRIKALSKK